MPKSTVLEALELDAREQLHVEVPEVIRDLPIEAGGFRLHYLEPRTRWVEAEKPRAKNIRIAEYRRGDERITLQLLKPGSESYWAQEHWWISVDLFDVGCRVDTAGSRTPPVKELIFLLNNPEKFAAAHSRL